MANPYADAKNHQLWRRGVASVEPHRLDPVVAPKFRIARTTRVGTAGSCFAQHIARGLTEMGFNYFVPEDGADLPPGRRARRGFGMFSARYGNIYTVEQLMQLFEEVFDGRTPHETHWQRPDDKFVDPYRPRIEPGGWPHPKKVIAQRQEHLAHVERVFRESELFVFTLGLTEAWRSRVDGSVFPLAPGVVAGSYDPALHEFHNFTVAEVTDTLVRFLERLVAVNRGVRVLLTVSPVPLIATHEDRHVLVSTVYSKSVLRVAAQTAADRFGWVDYFPSYEIITGSPTGGLYFEDDRREVRGLGVAHAMRCFAAHYLEGGMAVPSSTESEKPRQRAPELGRDIICDEEAIDPVDI